MSMDSLATYTRYANEIARNFAAMGEEKAALATADHIESFWDPRMKGMVFASDRTGLEPVAAEAVANLAVKWPSRR